MSTTPPRSVFAAAVRKAVEDRAAGMESRLKDLQADISQLEDEIDAIHEDIAKHTAELSETDLSYLLKRGNRYGSA